MSKAVKLKAVRTLTHKRLVEEIFDAALAVAPEERAAFLEQACAGNDELRWEVAELLEVEREQTFGLLPSGELAMVSILADLHPSLKGLSFASVMQCGRYEFLRSLGQGGMGTVFLAYDRRLHRRVAIKFLHAATREMTERFLAEARTTARCMHENIVVIHDVDEIDGRPYMVLEHLEGKPLRRHLADLEVDSDTASATPVARRREARGITPAMSVGSVLELVIPVVRALVCAHAQGIVHRDLKPENVFLCDNGTVKVLDFGIAKALTDVHGDASRPVPRERVITPQGALLGTLQYMSPEQWGVDEIDERTDLWAVGIMLYEMLAGQHPLAPLSHSKLQKQARDLDLPMPSIGTVIPGLGKLADVVDSCLRKRKAERIRSAEALLQALEAVAVERFPGPLEGIHAGTPTAPHTFVEDPDPYPRESSAPVREASKSSASGPRLSRRVHGPLAGWLAASVSWFATLALLTFWPRFSIPAFPGTSGGIILAVGAGAHDALSATHGALCASLRSVDARAVRCIELPRIGVGIRELRDAAAAAKASLVLWLDDRHGVRLLPVSTAAELLSELPTLPVGTEKTQQHLAGILHPLSRVLAGDLRLDVLRVPPVSSDDVGWRLAALAWYLNMLARNQQAISPADVGRNMMHCRQEVSLADTTCALIHYIYAQLDPTPPDARYWLQELLIHGPPSFADPVAIELAEDDCMHDAERVEAALLHLAARWEHTPCRRLTLIGPAKCLLTRYPHASTALQPVAYPQQDIRAQCEADFIAEPVEPEPPPISVMVTSEPAGAKVFGNDSTKPLGVTPYTYEAPSRMGQISLRLELEGYESAEVSLPGDKNGAAQVVLRASARRHADGRKPRKSSFDDQFGYR